MKLLPADAAGFSRPLHRQERQADMKWSGLFSFLGMLALTGCATSTHTERTASPPALTPAPTPVVERPVVVSLPPLSVTLEEDLDAYLSGPVALQPAADISWPALENLIVVPEAGSLGDLQPADLAFIPAPEGYDVVAPAQGGLLGLLIPKLYYWDAELSGVLTDGLSGNLIDVQNDLGVDVMEGTLMPELQMVLGGMVIRFNGFEFEFRGDTVLQRTIDFGGQTFTISDQVVTELDLQNYRLTAGFRVLNLPWLAVALQGGVAYYELEATVTSTLVGTANESIQAPVPVIGVLAQAKLGMFILSAEVSGISFSIEGVALDYYEINVSAGIILFRILSVQVGWRSIDINIEDSNLALDATLEGLYFGGAIHF